MEGTVGIDDSRFPIVIVYRGELMIETIDPCFATLDRWSKSGRRYAVTMDLSSADIPSATARKYIVASIGPREHALARDCLGLALVVPPPPLRGAITAMNWLRPPTYSVESKANMSEALARCQEWCEGLAISTR